MDKTKLYKICKRCKTNKFILEFRTDSPDNFRDECLTCSLEREDWNYMFHPTFKLGNGIILKRFHHTNDRRRVYLCSAENGKDFALYSLYSSERDRWELQFEWPYPEKEYSYPGDKEESERELVDRLSKGPFMLGYGNTTKVFTELYYIPFGRSLYSSYLRDSGKEWNYRRYIKWMRLAEMTHQKLDNMLSRSFLDYNFQLDADDARLLTI